MAAIWALPPAGATFEVDGLLRLSNIDPATGENVVFTFSDVPGKIGGKAWRDKATVAVQALMDNVLTRADLQIDDADKTTDAAQLLATYGERRTLDGGGLVDRSTIFSWEMTEIESAPDVGTGEFILTPVFRKAK